MIWAFKLLTLLAAFAFMEFVAWFTHKYVMHGFLWSLHKSHHQKDDHFFEWNDFFFLFFGSIGATLIITGFSDFDYKFFAGAGITLYGFTYITIHDILVHRRLRIFKTPKNRYLRAIRNAHRVHHSKIGKDGGEAFGLLWVARKYFD